jgi:hypothetical protein
MKWKRRYNFTHIRYIYGLVGFIRKNSFIFED